MANSVNCHLFLSESVGNLNFAYFAIVSVTQSQLKIQNTQAKIFVLLLPNEMFNKLIVTLKEVVAI